MLTFASNKVAFIPLVFLDANGAVVRGPVNGGQATCAPPGLAVVGVTGEGQMVQVIPLQKEGAGTVTYKDNPDGIETKLDITITLPSAGGVPVSVTFDETNVTFDDHPNPP